MNNKNSLLIELRTEEMPPFELNQIAKAFASNLVQELKTFFASSNDAEKFEYFATPRRFGVILHNIEEQEPDKVILKKGPTLKAGLLNSEPSPALLGFMKSCNIDTAQDLIKDEGDGYFYAKLEVKGQTLNSSLATSILKSLKKLPIAKNMRWGNKEYEFIRPVHGLVVMLNNKLIELEEPIFGLYPTTYTLGHRVLSLNPIQINNAVTYLSQLEIEGAVIADFTVRRQLIQEELIKKSQELGLILKKQEELIDEVTALTEFPVILHGEFDKSFLRIPQECLILTMTRHQRYFALLDKDNKLSNKFLLVANLKSTLPQEIINGNQKVLVARLKDAEFFFESDKKTPLIKRTEKLAQVVYHNKLGSQLGKVQRIQQIAANIAPLLNIDKEIASRCANLIKADLTTEMVQEFPELQGVMGKYYAIGEGESLDCAYAIEEHYLPKTSQDKIPSSHLGILLSLSDKLETLVGIWNIGLIPTGEKDPFALRRAAVGIIRILLETNIELNLNYLLKITQDTFNLNKIEVKDEVIHQIYDFIIKRGINYLNLELGYSLDCTRSILENNPSSFNWVISLAKALQNFATNQINEPLLNANKRIKNILNKSSIKNFGKVESSLFQEAIEQKLYQTLQDTKTLANNFANTQDWKNYFNAIGKLNQPVSEFFDKVMVMVEDERVKINRLTLLENIYKLLNHYCDLSVLNV